MLATQPLSSPQSRTENLAPEPMMTVSGQEPKILLVEDDVNNQAVTQAQLRILGLTCEVAANGVEALEELASKGYDLILLDCNMPLMDGYETTRQIRLNPSTRTLPIIAVTAHAFTHDRSRCLAAGMDDFLAKPYWLEDLQAKLQRYIPVPKPLGVAN